MSQRLGTFIASENAADLVVLAQLIEAGDVQPVIDRSRCVSHPTTPVPARGFTGRYLVPLRRQGVGEKKGGTLNRRYAKAIFALATVGSAGLASIVGALPASASVTCPGDIVNTTVNDSVVVPPGATCVIFNSTVAGSVSVGAGASITLVGATIKGSFGSSGAHDIRMGNCLEFGCAVSRRTVINGDVSIQGTSGVPQFPTRNVICDATFSGGSVVLQNNSAPFAIGNNGQCAYGGLNRIGGSLVLYNNTGAITLTSNQVGGYLQCMGNNPPPINGGGNTAGAGKYGQCAAF